ncbi:hypothetical protein [Stackebrandtia soli]|uniref:hypothetical protein n=1 Tax=Stackebrandtia soli TaxID=1892856 RepID=UPI0039EAAAD4
MTARATTPPIRSLDQLDEVPWSDLDNHGRPATDVPNHLRAMMSADVDERREAYRWWERCHGQGNLYEATPHIVPFLLHLLADPTSPDREALLRCVLDLVAPDVTYWLSDDLDVGLFRWIDNGYDEWISEFEADAATFDAVAGGVPVLVDLLGDEDPAIAASAAYLLGWFRRSADLILPRLMPLTDRELEPEARADVLLSLGLLARGDSGAEARAALAEIVDDPEDSAGWAAAVGLAMASAPMFPLGALRALIVELGGMCAHPDERDDLVRTRWTWAVSDLVLALLSRLPAEAVDAATTALASVLADPELPDDGAVTMAAIALVGVEGTDGAAITPWQRSVLNCLCGNDSVWESGELGEHLAETHGLPATAAEVRAWLSTVE